MKVSVCIVTYNQQKYIRECLDSIVNQETNFPFEVIVGDDASTDGTREIVQEFCNRYPTLVRAVFHEKNVGPTQNYFSVHNLAQGEYVAHLDGDDYALQGKLNALASHLDEHSDCAIVWHRMRIINEHGQSADGMPIVPMSHFIKSKKLYAVDLAKYYGMTGCHSGSMYRACAKKIHNSNEEVLDYFVTLSFVEDGYCAMYIEDVYGVYRCFSYENTVTRSKGSVIVGESKLRLIQYYLENNPSLAKSFSSQCFFEFLLRGYLRYPFQMAYFKMLFSCRSIPSILDVMLIGRIFMSNRHTKLQKIWVNTTNKK